MQCIHIYIYIHRIFKPCWKLLRLENFEVCAGCNGGHSGWDALMIDRMSYNWSQKQIFRKIHFRDEATDSWKGFCSMPGGINWWSFLPSSKPHRERDPIAVYGRNSSTSDQWNTLWAKAPGSIRCFCFVIFSEIWKAPPEAEGDEPRPRQILDAERVSGVAGLEDMCGVIWMMIFLFQWVGIVGKDARIWYNHPFVWSLCLAQVCCSFAARLCRRHEATKAIKRSIIWCNPISWFWTFEDSELCQGQWEDPLRSNSLTRVWQINPCAQTSKSLSSFWERRDETAHDSFQFYG